MKKIILCLTLLSICLITFAQKDKQAKEILDKTATVFKKSDGINAGFNIIGFSKNGIKNGSDQGTIRLKGNNFMLETSNTITWFDGHTQWSYLIASEEVNISNPTPEELQNINPYSLLNIYQQGYDYKYNGTKTFKGKQVYEVVLIPTNKKQDLASITLLISKTYQPLYIKLEQKDKARSEITATSFTTEQKFSDSLFKFDKKKYPEAEIIDLR